MVFSLSRFNFAVRVLFLFEALPVAPLFPPSFCFFFGYDLLGLVKVFCDNALPLRLEARGPMELSARLASFVGE